MVRKLGEAKNSKVPIFCSRGEKWKEELYKRLQTEGVVTLTALGRVRYAVLKHLNGRKDIKIVRIETKRMKNREKGLGLKIQVRKITAEDSDTD